MTGNRQTHADQLYRLLDELAQRERGPRRLIDATAKDGWPRHGVYFFFEDGEVRANGNGRVVRVGTHALTAASRATLWSRLRQHRGQIGGRSPGGGNHRASVFRRHVGAALIQRDHGPGELLDSWLDRRRPPGERAAQEIQVEHAVSVHIGVMPFLWLAVPDRESRASLERNSIALLSGPAAPIDGPGAGWLGRHAVPAAIRRSGLWNVEHVDSGYDPSFLRTLARLI
jgi:hypothetical protein